MDGWEVLRALKADPATPASRWSWSRSSTSGRAGAALGAAAYLVKPVSRDDAARPPCADVGAARRRRSERRGAGHERSAGSWSSRTTACNLKLVRDVLEHAGFEVVEATSGEDGVRLAARAPPRPRADGPAAARASTAPRRCGGSARRPPTTAMPGRRGDGVRDARGPRAGASTPGFDGYLEKPLSVRALPAQVRDFLRRRGGPDGRPTRSRCSSSTTSRRTSGCSTPCSRPRGLRRRCTAASGEEALAAARRGRASTSCCSTS